MMRAVCPGPRGNIAALAVILFAGTAASCQKDQRSHSPSPIAATSAPASAPPTLLDGRFAPGAIRLSVRILRTTTFSGLPMAVSDDGERVAIFRQVGGRPVMVPADEPDPPVPATHPSAAPPDSANHIRYDRRTAVFSPDGRRLAYVRSLGEQRAAAVIDGQQGTEYLNVDFLTFSSDSKRLAYIATLPDYRLAVVVDGKESQPCSEICGIGASRQSVQPAYNPIQFSPDSKRVAFGAGTIRPGSQGRNSPQHLLIVDGEAQKVEGGGVEDITWSPDSKRVAHVGVPPYRTALHTIHVDGKPGQTHRWILRGSLRFSPDSKRLVYLAADGIRGPVFVVDGGKEGKHYNYIYPDSLRFNPLGHLEFDAGAGMEHSGYAAASPWTHEFLVGKPIHVIDGQETDGFRSGVVWSADGKHAAWTVPISSKTFQYGTGAVVVVDGVPGKQYGQIDCLQFSPDGRHFAYLASHPTDRSQRVLVIDGIELRYPLSGYLTHVRYLTSDTLRAVNHLEGQMRIVDIMVVPAAARSPAPHPAAQLIKGAPASEAMVGQFRKVAALANPPQRQAVLSSIPYVYARHCDKEAALAALDALEADPAVSGVRLRMESPAQRRCHVLTMLASAQFHAGDKAGAARTAQELFAAVQAIENVQAAENRGEIMNAAIIFAMLGNAEGVDKALGMAQPQTPQDQMILMVLLAECKAIAGDIPGALAAAERITSVAQAVQAYACIAQREQKAGNKQGAADIWARALAAAGRSTDATEANQAYQYVAQCREKTGDMAGAADVCAKGLAAAESFPDGIDIQHLLAGLLRTGGISRVKAWRDGLSPQRRRHSNNILRIACERLLANREDAAMAQMLGLMDPAGDGHAEIASTCLRHAEKRRAEEDRPGALALLALACEAGAASDKRPLPISEFLRLAALQRELGDTAGIMKTAANAVKAYRSISANPAPDGPSEPGRDAQRLAELLMLAGDNAAAIQTLSQAARSASPPEQQLRYYPDTALAPMVEMVQLQVKAGDAAGAAEAVQRIRAAAAKATQEPGRTIALALLAEAQIAAGDLKGATESLTQCAVGENMANRCRVPPESVWVQLGIAQEARQDKAGAEQSYSKAMEIARAAHGGQWRRFSYWGAVALAKADAGDVTGSLAVLQREKDLPLLFDHLSSIAVALARAGDITAASRVLSRIDHRSGYGCATAVEQAAQAAAEAGHCSGAVQLLKHPGLSMGRPAHPNAVALAATRAGDIDAALQAMSMLDTGLVARMAQIRLNARDDAGAKRILVRGVEAAMAWAIPRERSTAIALLVNLMLDAGFKEEAHATLALAHPPTTRPTTQHTATTQQRSESLDAIAFDTADRSLVCMRVTAGQLDGVLAWAATINDPTARSLVLSEADDTLQAMCGLRPQAEGLGTRPRLRRP